MKHNRKGRTDGAGRAAYTASAEPLEPRRFLAATFTVTTAAADGDGSLARAILDANAKPGADSIVFDIPGAGVHRIAAPPAGMPAVTDSVSIDATTQPGYAGAPLIELVGSVEPVPYTVGLLIDADGCLVKGLAVECFEVAVRLLGRNNAVESNYLGLLADGTNVAQAGGTSSYNWSWGLSDWGDDNRIGGTVAAARNVVSGNDSGIGVAGANTLIVGNYVGTDPTGNAAVGNRYGISLVSQGTVIGGTIAAARNVISGNTTAGIEFDSGSVVGVTIQGNYIGTNAAGTAAVPNGVGIDVYAFGVVIGGREAGAGNVISGNSGHGVLVRRGAVVEGNWIGPGADARPLGNGGAGVWAVGAQIVGDASDPAAANVIAYNAGAGIAVHANRVTARGNSVFANGGLGIDLKGDGPTANDPLDADTGVNALQNFPVLTLASSNLIAGTLHSAPNATFTLDFYDDAPGGQSYLGAVTVQTGADGNAAFSVPLAKFAVPGHAVSATATSAAGHTSEFSAALTVYAPGDANRDGRVSFEDLVVLAQNYGAAGGKAWLDGDFTNDGAVDFGDLVLLAQHYAAAPPVAAEPAVRETSRGAEPVGVYSTEAIAPQPRATAKPVARRK